MLEPQKILEEWKEDSVIDNILIDESALKIPCLHSKYLDYLSAIRKQLRHLERTKKATPVAERRNNEEFSVLEEYISEHKDCLDHLEKIIYSINQMSFNISNIIKWRQFTNGTNQI